MNIALLVVGLVFALVGAALIWHQLQALFYFKPVEGKVIAIEKRTTPASGSKKQGGPMYYPVVEYIGSGNIKTLRGSTGSGWPTHDIGDKVTVLYSKSRNEARLKSMVPIVVGLIFGGVGIVLCYFFVTTFTFSYFSLALYGAMGAAIVIQGRRALKKRDISSFDELKEAFRNTEMKTRKGTGIEESNRIYDRNELAAHMRQDSGALKIVGPVFTVVGILVLGLGVYLGMKRADFLERALPADGEVIRLDERRSDDSYVYYPIVEFKVPGSYDVLTFSHDSGSNPPSYAVGEQVVVLYDPQNPKNAIIDAGLFNWMGTGLATLLGVIFTGAGISVIFHWHKYKKLPARSH